MRSQKELLDARKLLGEQNDALLKAAEAAGRVLTADERTLYDERDAEYDALTAEIEALKGDEARRLKQAARNKELGSGEGLGRRSQPSKPGQIGNIRLAAEDDPKKGFRDHRDFLLSVKTAAETGRLDERLSLCLSPTQSLTAGSDEHGTYSDAYGGFFVPGGVLADVLRLEPEIDPLSNLVRRVPMEYPTLTINARTDNNHSSSVSGGLRVYRRVETQTVASSRMQHEQVKLEATALFGVSHASEELLDRSPISFVELLQSGFRDEFGAKLLQERISGTGVGQFEGVLNSPCLISVSKEASQPAATIEKNNIDKMEARCWRYSQAVWLANHKTLPQLKSLVQEIGTGGVPVPYFSYTPDGRAMLNGRPLFFTEFCPTLGTVGDLILGCWGEYLEGTLTEVKSDQSMHVRFLEHERTFKFWLENDARSWWRSALTPKAGDTLSPFVVLETRA